MPDRVRYVFRWNLDDQLCDFGSAVHLPAKVQFVDRRDVLTDAFTNAMQTNCGDVVLGTRKRKTEQKTTILIYIHLEVQAGMKQYIQSR